MELSWAVLPCKKTHTSIETVDRSWGGLEGKVGGEVDNDEKLQHRKPESPDEIKKDLEKENEDNQGLWARVDKVGATTSVATPVTRLGDLATSSCRHTQGILSLATPTTRLPTTTPAFTSTTTSTTVFVREDFRGIFILYLLFLFIQLHCELPPHVTLLNIEAELVLAAEESDQRKNNWNGRGHKIIDEVETRGDLKTCNRSSRWNKILSHRPGASASTFVFSQLLGHASQQHEEEGGSFQPKRTRRLCNRGNFLGGHSKRSHCVLVPITPPPPSPMYVVIFNNDYNKTSSGPLP